MLLLKRLLIFNAAKEGDVALQKILKSSANNIDVKDSDGC